MDKKVVLKMENITKQFPGVKALDGVSMTVHEGEVLALLGENGAGKSTLIKIIAGVQQQNSGKMIFDGQEVHFTHPMQAKRAGVSVVYQELTNVPLLSVAENLFINHYGDRNRILNWKNMYREAEQILKSVDLDIDVKRPIGECNIAEKQQIEIARAVYERAKLLILDEPTSALNKKEIAVLLGMIRRLKEQGIAIILITHKMDEIFPVADSVVVLRDGATVAAKSIGQTNEQELINLMVGREITNMYPERVDVRGETVMRVSGLTNHFIRDVSFEVRRGEILGVYGLMGSGHLELGKTLFGCFPKTQGSAELDGQPLQLSNPKRCIECGIAFLPGERKNEGIVQIQTVAVNMMIPSYERKDSPKLIDAKRERDVAAKWIKRLAIKTNSAQTVIGTLSGGNQQKVILGKWLETKPKVIILNEPTRGIDVGAKVEIYKILRSMCQDGVAVIMITSEMPELIGMADRAIVMHEGVVQQVLAGHELTEDKIMSAAIGGNVK